MTVPHLRTIKEHQPEARLTLIAKPQFKELYELFPFVDKFVALPHGTMRRFRQLRAMGRSAKPESHVLFTNSMRGDLEACRRCGKPVGNGVSRKASPVVDWCLSVRFIQARTGLPVL